MIVEPVQTGWTLDEVRTLYGAALVDLIRTAGDVENSELSAVTDRRYSAYQGVRPA